MPHGSSADRASSIHPNQGIGLVLLVSDSDDMLFVALAGNQYLTMDSLTRRPSILTCTAVPKPHMRCTK